jgi:hypothetical protein
MTSLRNALLKVASRPLPQLQELNAFINSRVFIGNTPPSEETPIRNIQEEDLFYDLYKAVEQALSHWMLAYKDQEAISLPAFSSVLKDLLELKRAIREHISSLEAPSAAPAPPRDMRVNKRVQNTLDKVFSHVPLASQTPAQTLRTVNRLTSSGANAKVVANAILAIQQLNFPAQGELTDQEHIQIILREVLGHAYKDDINITKLECVIAIIVQSYNHIIGYFRSSDQQEEDINLAINTAIQTIKPQIKSAFHKASQNPTIFCSESFFTYYLAVFYAALSSQERDIAIKTQNELKLANTLLPGSDNIFKKNYGQMYFIIESLKKQWIIFFVAPFISYIGFLIFSNFKKNMTIAILGAVAGAYSLLLIPGTIAFITLTISTGYDRFEKPKIINLKFSEYNKAIQQLIASHNDVIVPEINQLIILMAEFLDTKSWVNEKKRQDALNKIIDILTQLQVVDDLPHPVELAPAPVLTTPAATLT